MINFLFLQSVSFDKVHENCWLKRQIFSDKESFHSKFFSYRSNCNTDLDYAANITTNLCYHKDIRK